MEAYTRISSAAFDALLAPFGHRFAAFDLLLWPVILGIGALVVYKYASNQKAIARVKSQISMHLLEIRLFSHDILQVLKSTGSILIKNTWYVGQSLLPMAVMIVPMVLVMVQLVSHYAYAPAPPGAVELLRLRLDPAAGLSTRDVSLELPAGVELDAPAVRTADGRVFWRVRAEQEGDHVLTVKVGDRSFEKVWAVGGDARQVPSKRLRGWEALLYPAEPPIPSDAAVLALELDADTRSLGWFPDGELGILMWTLVWSLVAGFALRGVFGVTF
jgi:hypothetical protein